MLIPVLILAFLLEGTMSSTSGCCNECPDQIELARSLPGENYDVDCVTGSDHVVFHLDNVPLNVSLDTNLHIEHVTLKITSLNSSYEGFYSCSSDNINLELQNCIYVLGVARFLFCSEDTCTFNKTVAEGQNVTLDFSIIYENGGCDITSIELLLSEPGGGNGSPLQVNNYNYNCSTKIRNVTWPLTHVTKSHQGLYNMTMSVMRVYNGQWINRRGLIVNLTVLDALVPTSSEESSTIGQEHPTVTSPRDTIHLPSDNKVTNLTLSAINPVTTPTNTILSIVIVFAVVMLVVGVVTMIVGILCWRKQKGNTKLPEGGGDTTVPECTTRKPSDTTTTTSSGSPAIQMTCDLTESMESLTTCETTCAPGSMMVEGGALEEEGMRQHGLVAMKQGIGNYITQCNEELQQCNKDNDVWTDRKDICTSSRTTWQSHWGDGQQQVECCSRTTCTRQCPAGNMNKDFSCGLRKAKWNAENPSSLDQDSGRRHHQQDSSTTETPVDHYMPHNEPQGRMYPSSAFIEDGQGTLRLVKRPSYDQEHQKLDHFQFHIAYSGDYYFRRARNCSNRASITSSPGGAQDCYLNGYFSSSRDV